MRSSPLYLEPRLEPRLRSLLADADFARTLVDALGSPLNLVLPEQIAENVTRFREVYRRHHLQGGIFFAHKANRSSALVRRLTVTEAGIDVSSLGELQHALGAGCVPERIMATGPKNPEFRWLAARTGVILNVDSRAELLELAALVGGYGLPRVRVMLRLSGFAAPGVTVLSRPSRFGSSAEQVDGLLDAVEKHRDALDMIGVGYHLDTVGVAEKAVALDACLLVMDECRRRGLSPRAIDIGGGFGVNYLAHAAQWEQWTSELGGAVLGGGPRSPGRGTATGCAPRRAPCAERWASIPRTAPSPRRTTWTSCSAPRRRRWAARWPRCSWRTSTTCTSSRAERWSTSAASPWPRCWRCGNSPVENGWCGWS